MNFLVLLLVLWVEKLSSGRRRIQQDGPWRQWLVRCEGQAPWPALLLAVLLPVALLGLLLLILEPLAYGWLALPVHLLVVVYSLGRGDVLAALGPFRDAWRRGDAWPRWLASPNCPYSRSSPIWTPSRGRFRGRRRSGNFGAKAPKSSTRSPSIGGRSQRASRRFGSAASPARPIPWA